MKKKNRIKNFLDWFFEEEKEKVPEQGKGEYVEISFGQLVLLVIVTIVFMFWIIYPDIFNYFKYKKIDRKTIVNEKIEKNYFNYRNNIENGDFSLETKHWWVFEQNAAVKNLNSSSSKIKITNECYNLAPASLQIQSPCSFLYSKKAVGKANLDVPYNIDSPVWLGVLPGSKVEIKFSHKGDELAFFLMYLTAGGDPDNLYGCLVKTAPSWEITSVIKQLPENARAIAVYFNLNGDGKTCYLDDVKVTVDKK